LASATGDLGGFVGPCAVGWSKESAGSFTAGMGVLAASLAIAAALALLVGRQLLAAAPSPVREPSAS
jgi:ACS family tartrate transporter-like MFS transporter